MNKQSDAAWRLRWLRSKDGCEVEAWVIADKGYKIGSITKRVADRTQKSRKHLWR